MSTKTSTNNTLQKSKVSSASLRITFLLALVLIAGLAIQSALLIMKPQGRLLTGDELSFINNTRLLMKVGYSKDFLINLKGQAFGPLLNFVHYIASPWTSLQAPQVRILHLALTAILFLCLALLIKQRRPDSNFALALTFAGIPMLWQASGGVWSMVPAMITATLGIALLLSGLNNSNSALLGPIFRGLIGGGCFGLSILGRTTFLAAIPFLPLLLINNPRRQTSALIISAFAAVSLAISIPMLTAWGGLLPPQQQFVGEGIAPWHLILSFGYGFLLILFSAHQWLNLSLKSLKFLLNLMVACAMINYFFLRFSFLPMLYTFKKILPAQASILVAYVFPGCVAGLAVFLVAMAIRSIIRHRHDGQILFLLVAGFAMLLSAVKVTHIYSSVYALQSLPFLALPLSINRKISLLDVLISSAGVSLGLISYNTWIGG